MQADTGDLSLHVTPQGEDSCVQARKRSRNQISKYLEPGPPASRTERKEIPVIEASYSMTFYMSIQAD
jgi:hypothetical protein